MPSTKTYDKFMSLSVQERRLESDAKRLKHDDRFPLIVTGDPPMSKFKFLVEGEYSMGVVMQVIRAELAKSGSMIAPEEALWTFVVSEAKKDSKAVEPILLNGGMTVSVLYEEYKHADGFLHIKYSKENVFGCQ